MAVANQNLKKLTGVKEHEIDMAIDAALARLESLLPRFTDSFATPCTTNFRYKQVINDGWTCGMQTGLYWLAYELSGSQVFLKAAQKQLKSYEERLNKMVCMDTHDVGFIFTPSCVAAYKLTGSDYAKRLALRGADVLLEGRYSKHNGVIYRRDTRILIDTMMNLPLLFWAGQMTGDSKYAEAASSHYHKTMQYLVRDDYSTFHHFQFDPITEKPIGGLTYQGHADNSCWSRGQAWGICGFPLAYDYTGDDDILSFYEHYTDYFLNHLPSDSVPFWDFDFKEGDDAPRDTSAAAIAVCGLDEACKVWPQNSTLFQSYAAARDGLMAALLKNDSRNKPDTDGLLLHVTHALPQGEGIDECAIYGDYFYLEALMRYKNKNWIRYW